MSEQDDIEKLTKQLLRIHIDRDRLATEERAILTRLAKLDNSGTKRDKIKTKVKREEIEFSAAKKDRFGNILRIGDRVEFLTEGKYEHRYWTIYRLTEKRVLCERKSTGQRTHREYHNVRRIVE